MPLKWLLLIMGIMLAGCSEGAVVFAPPPPPPDVSPLRYEHPGGAFWLDVPRIWSVYTQNTTTLAAASFALPGESEPALLVAVMRLDSSSESSSFADIINRYQTEIRPDASRYTEEDRQAMGDGSWRLSGLRQNLGGTTRQVNTFLQRTGDFIGLIEVNVPADADSMTALQTAINTFTINPDAPLQPAGLPVLAFAAGTALEVLHVNTWTTPGGVFYITGEVANRGAALVTDVPVRAVLYTPDNLAVAEAVDVVMGYGIAPGGFAPFSLRFGQGQPSLTDRYELILGNEEWQPSSETVIIQDALTWTDESGYTGDGQLYIRGTLTNIGDVVLNRPRVIVSIFDAAQNVIAAGYVDPVSALLPGQTQPFQMIVPDIGGEPLNYIINAQALP